MFYVKQNLYTNMSPVKSNVKFFASFKLGIEILSYTYSNLLEDMDMEVDMEILKIKLIYLKIQIQKI